ncbi:hypothetical protein [Mesorhizobium sp. CO1-1-8]|uniref:hypothetical protein n=1 Tax=Mesorhizobium sp. CO1-1-8 TaxID=2876631 RepID=UPI001CD0E8D7|nr:hypothetical protein [Mesorhizobium sp. CO1-1-8]MBZ9774979.1 hypothetical protein [Mesorhizobium sp. CO1-1-8]
MAAVDKVSRLRRLARRPSLADRPDLGNVCRPALVAKEVHSCIADTTDQRVVVVDCLSSVMVSMP